MMSGNLTGLQSTRECETFIASRTTSIVWILTAGTGCGHLSGARSMADACAAVRGPSQRVTIAVPLGERVDGSYGWMITRAPKLWGACDAASHSAAGSVFGRRLLWSRFGARYSRLISDLKPSVIVSVHALCKQLASDYLWGRGSSTPLHCVVTDLFDVHRLWVASNQG